MASVFPSDYGLWRVGLASPGSRLMGVTGEDPFPAAVALEAPRAVDAVGGSGPAGFRAPTVPAEREILFSGFGPHRC